MQLAKDYNTDHPRLVAISICSGYNLDKLSLPNINCWFFTPALLISYKSFITFKEPLVLSNDCENDKFNVYAGLFSFAVVK